MSSETLTAPLTRAGYRAGALVRPAVGGKRYRLEIEGLRAVAALLVAAYHVWIGKVSGGVDVFFVVAGFMITTTILGHYERSGRLSLGLYLGRLMSRLLPNALLVLVAVSAATAVFLPVTSWRSTYHEIAASTLYWENWALIERSVDYLERDGASSPVQHFWAMSVQGQFYLLWVLIAVVALVLRGRRTVDQSMFIVILAASVASFAFSLYLTGENQPVAYFHTLTRVWEFGAGGLAALLIRRGVGFRGRRSTAFGLVGLVLIITCGVALPVQDAFPGWAALWPVTGALLILFAGESPTRLSASGFLSRPTLVRLGSVSYAIYLWHWPTLVFWLRLADRPRAGLVDGAAVVAASILLAFASTRLVERPLRSRASRIGQRVSVAAGSIAALAVGSTAWAVSVAEPDAVEVHGPVGAELVRRAASGRDLDLRHGNTDQPVPGVPAAAEDTPEIWADDCATMLMHSDVVTCEYGDPEGDLTMVLAGGSHSAHWLPGLDVAARDKGWRVVTFIKDGCRMGYTAPPGEDRKELLTCTQWNREALPQIIDLDPDLLVMTSTVSGRDEPETLPDSYLETWVLLAEHEIPVLAIRDTPRAIENRVECLAENGPTSTACDVERRSTLADVSPTEILQPAPGNVHFVDLTPYFCDETSCPAVIGNTVVYSDRNHITATYSRSLSGVLGQLLDEVPLR